MAGFVHCCILRTGNRECTKKVFGKDLLTDEWTATAFTCHSGGDISSLCSEMSLSEKREMGPSHPPEEMLTFAHTCTSVEEEKGAEAGGAEGFGLGWEANGGGSGLGVLSPRFTEEEIQPRAAQVCFACAAPSLLQVPGINSPLLDPELFFPSGLPHQLTQRCYFSLLSPHPSQPLSHLSLAFQQSWRAFLYHLQSVFGSH